MKKDINNTEEQLYDQFMAELEEGANEYDRMMVEGEAPALKAAKSRTTIVSMARWAAVAACFFGVVATGAVYFLQNNAEDPQVAIADKPVQKVLPAQTEKVEEVAEKPAEETPAEVKIEKKSAAMKRGNINEVEEAKADSQDGFVLPDVVLTASSAEQEIVAPDEYVKERNVRDFYVVCYTVLPEVGPNDGDAQEGANMEPKQICDKIYFNDVKLKKQS